MLNTITWQGYWATLALLSLGYYLLIYLLYYRNDFKIAFPKQGTAKNNPSASPAVASFLREQVQPTSIGEDDLDFETPESKTERLIYACMDEVNAYLDGVKGVRCAKPEFIFAVQKILSKYPGLKGSEFRDSITKMIVSEAAHNCSIHLKEEEVIHVWLGR